jgi:hypothetical protein
MSCFFQASRNKRCCGRPRQSFVGTRLLAFSGEPADDPGSDIAARLSQFADDIDFRYADETKAIMLEAADTIRILRLMLGIKQEVIDEPM